MKRVSVGTLLLLLLGTVPALADPVCGKLAWPLDSERALLNRQNQTLQSGTTASSLPGSAFTLALSVGTTLPHASTKPVDPAKFAGYVELPAEPAGDVFVSLSAEAWVDIFQDGALLASTAFTGDANCPGLRKSVRFKLSGSPATLQLSNAATNSIRIAITWAP